MRNATIIDNFFILKSNRKCKISKLKRKSYELISRSTRLP